MQVIKRNGTRQEFDKRKIKTAILKSIEDAIKVSVVALDKEVLTLIADAIAVDTEHRFNLVGEVSVDNIHNYVEASLMQMAPEVAKQYMLKRHSKGTDRQQVLLKAVETVLHQSDPTVVNENSNKDSRVIPVQRDMLAGQVAKQYALEHMLPKKVAQAHKDGLIHFHK